MARITALVAAATLCNAWTPAQQIRPRSLQLRAADEDFDVDMMLLETEEKMQKSIAACVSNLGALRTGRASPDVLKRVVVDYYGAETPLNQLASISVASGTQLVVSPFDKSTLGDVEAALLDANLGMTPNNDGEIIRLNIPQLTEDRRKDVAKEAKAVGEEAKVAVRSTRKKAKRGRAAAATSQQLVYIVRWTRSTTVDDFRHDVLYNIETCGDDIEEAKEHVCSVFEEREGLGHQLEPHVEPPRSRRGLPPRTPAGVRLV